MSSSCSGNEFNNSLVVKSTEAILHELHTLEWDELIGPEEAQPVVQSKAQPVVKSKTKPPIMTDLMVQCARCLKWRLIPSMQKYEIIREKQVVIPFVCETASEWKPYVSCHAPEDVTECGIWAIDVPSIPRPPTGWERVVQIRREESDRFADVYYYPPSKKRLRLRSTSEVERFLNNHPEHKRVGVDISQFSFQVPKPLDENYVKKRTRPVKPTVATEGDHEASQHGQSTKKTRT